MFTNKPITTNSLFITETAKTNTVFQGFVTTQINGVTITVDSGAIPAQQLQQLNTQSTIENNLINVVNVVKMLLNMFAEGKYTDLVSKLSTANYINVSKLIYDIRLDPNVYPNYETLRTTIALSFQQLYQSFNIHAQEADCTATIEALRKKEAILDNLTLLKEYLLEMQSKINTYAFEEQKVSAPLAILKPEYAKYIQLYGYPKNMVFDTDKLAAIVASM